MKQIFTLFFLLAFAYVKGWSQVSNYSFVATSGTYTALSGANVVSPVGTETSFATSDDEGAYNNLPIGFTFTYGGTAYTRISASTNGFASFGTTLATGDGLFSGGDYSSNDLTDGTGVSSSGDIAPLWDDLDMNGSTFSYQTSGTTGNLVFTMEWKNVVWAHSNSIFNNNNTPTISFQAKLYQATGAVQYIYQRVNNTTFNGNPSASIGIGYTTNPFTTGILSLSSAGAAPTVSSTENSNIGSKPANGQTYTFTPPVIAPPVLTSLSSSSGCAGSSITITGTKLSNAISVTIGGTPVSSVTSNTATQIVAVIGNGTSGNVVVTTAGGTSNGLSFSVSTAVPGTVGAITGTTATCAGSVFTYSVSSVANASSYAWTVPAGWTITNGQGSNTIVVTAGGAGQNGSITVVAGNACGISSGVNGSVDITPISAANNTGFTSASAKTSGDITVASSSSSGAVRLGYLKFPLNSIPSNATISSSTLSLTNFTTDANSTVQNSVTGLADNDPTTTTASLLFTAINGGTVYNSNAWSNSSTIALSLNSDAVADVQSRIASPGYLALGLNRGAGSSVYKFYGFGGGINAPKLTVAYTTPRSLAVTVKAVPSATLSGTPQTVCPSGNVPLTVTFTGTAPWTVGYTDGTTNYSLNTSTNPYTLSAPVPNNTSGSNSTVTYALRATTLTDNSGCLNGATPGTVAVTVKSKALAAISAAPSTICSGGQTTINFSSSTGAKVNYSINGTVQASQLTLPAGGAVTGIPSGILTTNATYAITGITASNTNYCDNASPSGLSTIVAIQALPTVSAITVPSSGAYAQTSTTLQLSDAPPASATGAWTSSSATSATVSNTGLVTGLGEGTPTITYTVTDNTSLQCKNSTTQIVRVYNPDYITKAGGNFSTAATWQIDRDDNTFATTVPVPSGTNYTSIRVQHALTLDQDFAVRSGTNFSLITGGAMTIAPGKIFSSSGTVDFGGKLVTVKSDASGTASIGQVSSAIANASNVTVERYTDGGNATSGRRAWRLMTSPITGQNIRNAWQEGGATNTGYGTLITGESLSSSQAASAGFDYIAGSANHTSIKEYTNGAWVPLANNSSTGTNISVRTKQAYLVFVRGNRTVQATGAGVTNLRANGVLIQGNQSIPLSSNTYTVVGNPYASSIDFGSIISNPSNSPVIKDQFYLWNSKYGTYGAYVLVTHDGTNGGYKATPAQITGIPAQNNDNYRYIPSGSGFFVSPVTGVTSGTVTIREQDKVSNTPPVNPFRIVPNATDLRQLMVNLNQKNSDSTSMLADGFRAKFSADYEGNEEDNSAAKPSNFNENLGLIRNGITHIIEAHDEVKKTDTLQLRMWNVSYRSYELQLMGENFTTAPGIKAWLEDSYLGSKQAVDLSGNVTTVSFEVNKDSGSWKSTRFRIVFENTVSALPVTITKVSASPKNGGAEVAWTVTNEVNVKGYTVEKSADGRSFTTVGTQQPARNNPQAALTNYSGYDATPKTGDNYYRIRVEGNDGKISYSEIVKVTIGATGTGIQITLYPNPVREGKANLVLTNLKEGTYLVSVFSGSGQTVYQKKVTIAQAGVTQSEQLLLGNSIAQGSYQLQISDEKGKEIKSITLMTGK